MDNNLSKEERKQERNKRKSLKHRARMDTLREHMNAHHDASKPCYISDNIAYAVVAGLEALVVVVLEVLRRQPHLAVMVACVGSK